MMKKIIPLTLLAIAMATPAFADDAPAKPAQQKPAASHPMMHHSHMMKDNCDEERGDIHGHGMMDHEHGMMGGHDTNMMMEPNMHLLHALNLSDEQHAKIRKLAGELKHNNWAVQGQLNDESAKLADLYEADHRDTAAISKEYQQVFDLKRRMIENYLDIENRIEDVLTPEQRARMKDERRRMHEMYERPMY
jgi:Spy/CpxP family protein refolding chaperone